MSAFSDEMVDLTKLMMLVEAFGDRLIVQHAYEPPPEMIAPHIRAETSLSSQRRPNCKAADKWL